VVNAADAARAQGLLTRAGETVWRIGTIRQRRGQEAQVAIV
jgi:phosphoribosylaminoimidazole (AIR) synthetase